MNKELPKYLIDKNNLIVQLTISILFAIVFLVIYSPYSNTTWFATRFSDNFIYTSFFVILSMIFLIISRVIMYYSSKIFIKFTYLIYTLWNIAEIVLIGSFHSLVSIKMVHISGYSSAYIWSKSVLITFIALGFPYVVTSLWFALTDARNLLMVTNSEKVASDGEVIPEDIDMINITDNNGVLRLTVKLDNLYYIKSDGNYVKIFYIKKGVMSTFMLRSKIQTIEETFANTPLMRCHRTYIVNINKIKVLRNEPDGYYIDFDHAELDSIPISKTYSDKIVKRFADL
ncbi:MAG: LytR/AlgR family response regulator transcription factor [Candidatus Limimorpha sp.]